jgi:hypothetical protein
MLQINYQEYIKSDRWRRKREKVIKRAGGVCEECRKGRIRHVHHLTYKRLGNEWLSDLLGLCFGCHQAKHPNRRLSFGCRRSDIRKVENPEEVLAREEKEFPFNLEKMKIKAKREPLPNKADIYTPRLQFLVKVCSLLQKWSKRKPFSLPLRLASKIIGDSPEGCKGGFYILQSHGILELVELGNNYDGKASTYWYRGEVEDEQLPH